VRDFRANVAVFDFVVQQQKIVFRLLKNDYSDLTDTDRILLTVIMICY